MSWDPDVGVLTVGERSVTLTCAPGDNECILRTYLHLVAEQRALPLGRSIVLRRDDVLVLAELLDLDDVRLEKQLAAILRLSDPEAKALRRDLLRQRVTAAALGVGMVAGVPLATAASAANSEPDPAFERTVTLLNEIGSLDWPATPTTAAITIEAAEVAPAPAAAEPPAASAASRELPPQADPPPWTPPAEDGVDIGYTVTYEQDPTYVPPEGVEIGSSMVIERDLPPAPPGHQPDDGEPGPPDHAEAAQPEG